MVKSSSSPMDPSTSSPPSFVTSYLMNSCGLSEKEALKASKAVKFITTKKPDNVVKLLEFLGFTKADITNLISRRPRILTFSLSVIKPKLIYLFSKHVSKHEIIKSVTNTTVMFKSLENDIIPCFDFLKNLLGSDTLIFAILQHIGTILKADMYGELILSNFELLRDAGVPENHIISYFRKSPRDFMKVNEPDRFKEAVQEVKSRGIDPCKYNFVDSMNGLVGCCKMKVEERMNAYRKWGWTDDELENLLEKHPLALMKSVRKIDAIMDLLMNQMGCSFSDVRRDLSIFQYALERFKRRLTVYHYLISIRFIEEGACGVCRIVSLTEEAFLRRFVIQYEEEAPELWQAFNRRVVEEGMQGSSVEKEEAYKSKEDIEIVAVPMDEKLLEDSQASVLNSEVVLDKVEESMKAKRPKKILKKSKKKVEEVQISAAKKGEEDKPNEEEKNDDAPVVEKVVEDSQARVLKRKVVLDKVEDSKKDKRPKKILKKSKRIVEEVPDSVAIKYNIEASELLQVSIAHVMEDSKNEEVTFCPERNTESVAALPKEVVYENQAGKSKKSDLVEQEVELKAEESKKARKPKKVLKNPNNKVEEVHGSAAIKYNIEAPELVQAFNRRVVEEGMQGSNVEKEEADKSKEDLEIVAVPMDENLLEDSQASVLNSEFVLDKVEESMKGKRPKKVLKKSKKKVEEVQSSAAKKGEEDKPNEEEKNDDAPVVEKVVEDSQARVLTRKVVLDKVEDSKKDKRPKKVMKKSKRIVEEVPDSAAIKYNIEASELLQASNARAMEDSKNEEVTFCPERDTESVAALPKEVVYENQAGKSKKGDLVEQEEELKAEESKKARKPKKVLKKPKKKVEEVHGSADIKYDIEAPELLQAFNRRVAEEGMQGSNVEKEEADKSKEDIEIVAVPMDETLLEDSQASVLNREVVLDKVEESMKGKRPKKVLKKSKKKVEEVQSSAAKKGEEDKPNEEEKNDDVPVVEKVVEDSQARVFKRKVVLDKVEDSKKDKMPKKVLKKSKRIVEEVPDSAAIKCNIEASELLQVYNQAFNRRVVEEGMQGSSVEKEGAYKSKEDIEIVAVPMDEKLLEDNQASVLNSEVVLDKVEESMKAKRPKKVLKKSKKKVEEVQISAAKKGEEDKPNEEEKNDDAPVVEKVVEDSQARVLKRKVVLDKVEDSKKDKRTKKVLKKSKRIVEEVPDSAAIKYNIEASELLQASIARVMEDSKNEEVTFCPERDTGSVAALPKEVVYENQAGNLRRVILWNKRKS